MALAYFDCFSGVAGDMILGALVDAGLPLKLLREQLARLDIGSYKIERIKKSRPIRGTNIHVSVREEPSSCNYSSLDDLIAKSGLKKSVRDMARAIFERLAQAEAQVHGVSLNKVHFHEVGGADSVVDIVGAAIGFDYFRFNSIHASPLPMSRGSIRCAHGTLPVPAPATLELIKGLPLEPASVKEEMVTPTGAAILTTVASHFGECPLQTVSRVGTGFGDREIPRLPNVVRLLIGEGFSTVVVQANIDDMNPQIFDHVIDRLFAAGAVDVDLAAVQMKKNRPGVRLSALVPWERKENIIDVILAETTTFGVRYWPVERRVLTRKLTKEKLKGGAITFKVGRDSKGQIVKALPEYEDVRRLARKTKRPLVDVYREALAQGRRLVKFRK